jgi:hypothetical protein
MWNFLAYMESDHPFSEKFYSKTASKKLRSARNEVDRARSEERWLNYAQLARMYRGLSSKEKRQLTDYIIVSYLPFDNRKLLSYYKSRDMMHIAINSNTGSEYNIREEYSPDSDLLYEHLFRFVKENLNQSPKSVLMLPVKEKIKLANCMTAQTCVSQRMIAKFLHIQLTKVRHLSR